MSKNDFLIGGPCKHGVTNGGFECPLCHPPINFNEAENASAEMVRETQAHSNLIKCMEERQILFDRNVELHASLAEVRAELARLTKERRTKDSERIDTLENIVRRVEAERDEAKDKLAANAENAAIR